MVREGILLEEMFHLSLCLFHKHLLNICCPLCTVLWCCIPARYQLQSLVSRTSFLLLVGDGGSKGEVVGHKDGGEETVLQAVTEQDYKCYLSLDEQMIPEL